ncbi:outer membrane beta-barrel protein [Geobacter argillaceus]|uniref:outer membrane beta-barrel protein n=1 Tax=Geobacter argillaceus TaxID=345631 RepID=UPI001478DDAD|nr:outer membrane beta-barrel protein [Geobacter argillaceus]
MISSRNANSPRDGSASGGSAVRLLVIAGIVHLAAGLAVARADEIKVTPAVTASEEFNDNILFSTIARKSDVVTTLSPSLELADNSARHNLSILGGINWLTYAKMANLDSVDYQYRGQAGYRLSPLTAFSASGAYVRNSRPDSINQLTMLSSSSGKDSYNYAFSANRKLDELTSATMSYSYASETYDNPALLGNKVHTAGMAVNRNFGNLLTGAASAGYSRNIYRDSQSDDYSLGIGSSWQQSEHFSWNASVGGRFTHSSFLVLQQATSTTTEATNDNWGVTGLLSLAYTGEKNRATLSFVRDFTAASGQIGATERTQVGLTLGRQFLEKFAGQAAITYTINSSPGGQFSAQGAEDKAIRCSADLDYEISRHFSMGLRYAFYRIDYSPSNQSAVQNMVLMQANWKYPVDRFAFIENK